MSIIDCSGIRRAKDWSFLHAVRAGRAKFSFCVNDSNARVALRKRVGADSGRKFFLMDGYFQDHWFQEDLEACVSLLEARCINPVVLRDEVVVHVRGGDFKSIPEFAILGDEYYARALKWLRRQVGLRAPALNIVTDDEAWARRLLGESALCQWPSVAFAARGSAVSDFQKIRCARYRVIPNSTFSWWAAALGAAESLTVAVSHWTANRPREYRLRNEYTLGREK